MRKSLCDAALRSVWAAAWSCLFTLSCLCLMPSPACSAELSDELNAGSNQPPSVAEASVSASDEAVIVPVPIESGSTEPATVSDRPLAVANEPLSVFDESVAQTDAPVYVPGQPFAVTNEPLPVSGKFVTQLDIPVSASNQSASVTNELLPVSDITVAGESAAEPAAMPAPSPSSSNEPAAEASSIETEKPVTAAPYPVEPDVAAEEAVQNLEAPVSVSDQPVAVTAEPATQPDEAAVEPAPVASSLVEPATVSDQPTTATAEPAVKSDEVTPVAEVPETKSDETAAEKPAAEPEKTVTASRQLKPHLSARLRVEYNYRSQGDAKDTDIYGYFYGNARDLKNGHLDVYMSARLQKDLDKPSSDSLADDPYRGLDDANGVTENRLLQLYFDIHDRNKRVAFRGGRQYVDIADYLHLDGGQAMFFENEKLGGRVYLGQPVSYYSGVSGDLAGGLSLVGRPWEGNQTRLTLARYYEDSEDKSDQNYFLDIRQKLSEEIRTRGQISVLNEKFRMGRLDMFCISADGETDLSFGGSYWGEFDARTRAYSPLYNTLGKQQPYAYTYGRLTQQVVPSFFVSPGVSLRFAESGDNDFYNRDYERYDMTFIYEPVRAFTTSISLEYWKVKEEDSFMGLTAEARYRYRRIWEVSGGTSYAQYTYDTYSDLSYIVNGGQTVFSENGTIIEESPYVYTYFLRAKWNITRKVALRVQLDIEDDETTSDLAYWGRGSIEVKY